MNNTRTIKSILKDIEKIVIDENIANKIVPDGIELIRAVQGMRNLSKL